MKNIQVFHSIHEFKLWRKSLPNSSKLGFVPTMGALHQGHAKLLKAAVKENEVSVLSVFVNPTQFGPTEDFSKYPKMLEKDINLAQSIGVTAILAPSASEVYPSGYTVYVDENERSKGLCGEFRPGHFKGVCTVVLKLFNIVEPTTAYFGLKDIQQFFVIQKMVEDLNLDLNLVGVQTERAVDGLALSSRNAYLSENEQKLAPHISKILNEAKNLLLQKQIPAGEVLSQSRNELEGLGFHVQYLELKSLPHLQTITDSKNLHCATLATAVFTMDTKTRLIDNVLLNETNLNHLIKIL